MWKLRTALTAAIAARLKSYPAKQKKRRRSAHSALKQRVFTSDQWAKVCRDVGSNGGTHGHASSYQSSTVQRRFAKNKFLTAPEMCATMVMQCRAAFAHTPNM